MADSRHNRRHGDWSKIVDDLFDQIAMRLDFTGAVRLAASSKEFYCQVANGKGTRYPNDGRGELVAYREFHGHKIACPHGPCTCTEPGCEFAAPPAALLAHLREAHSMMRHSFCYGKRRRYVSRPLAAPGSPIVILDRIGPGDDGTVFAVRFDSSTDIVVSVVCVRSAACLSPRYKVKYFVTLKSGSRVMCSLSMASRLPSSASPGTVLSEFEGRKSFCPISRNNLGGREPSEFTLDYSIRIDKIHKG